MSRRLKDALWTTKRARELRQRADQARDARDWIGAAESYGRYLEERVRDGDIWVQRGHCLKEAGQLDEALKSYLRAEGLMPRDADLQLQLGHLHKVRGVQNLALQRYRRALEFDRENIDARWEIERLGEERFPEERPASQPFAPDAESPWQVDTGVAGEAPPAAEPQYIPEATKAYESPSHYVARIAADLLDGDAWRDLTACLAASRRTNDNDSGLQEATAAMPGQWEALLRLGRVLSQGGLTASALRVLSRAFALEPRLPIAEEMRRIGARRDLIDRQAPLSPRAAKTFFEITDLLDVMSVRGTVTGIQRVQCNLVSGILALAPPPSGRGVGIVFWRDRRLWAPRAEDLRELIGHIERCGASDPEGRDQRLQAVRDEASLVLPQAGDAVISTGVAYLVPEISICGQELKRAGVSLGAILHDFIPLTHRDLVSSTLTMEFGAAISDILLLIDFALPNSEYTGTEAARLMQHGGYPSIPICAVPLARSLETTGHAVQSKSLRWRGAIADLKGQEFVLCVGSFAAHKNQALLFEVWRLLAKRGPRPPILVLVGHKAYGSGDLFQRLSASRYLDGRIRVFEELDDDQIRTLYDACLFTVFPSKVEGWGLPVGESLAHGKLCVASNAASIPEVGGEFAVYFDPYNAQGLADVVAGLLQDRDRLAFLESRIKAHFKPRTWLDYASDLVAAIDRLAAPEGSGLRTEPLALAAGSVLKVREPSREWDHGEFLPPRDLQAGTALGQSLLVEGWFPPEYWGVWMKGTRARLGFNADVGVGSKITVTLQLRAAQWARDNLIVVTSACGASAVVDLPPLWSLEHERATHRNMVVVLDCTAGEAGRVDLTIEATGAPAPSWWGEARALVLGLVRVMFLDAETTTIPLEPNKMARPMRLAPPGTPRMVALGARTLEMTARRNLVVIEGRSSAERGSVRTRGGTAKFAFEPGEMRGAQVRVVVVATCTEMPADLEVKISAGGRSNLFQIDENPMRLWIEGTAPESGPMVIALDTRGPAGKSAELTVTGVAYGSCKTARERLDLLEATLCPDPASEDIAEAFVEALRQSLGFVVAGHMKGSYSLAHMNRRLALGLEELSPGRVRIEQVEGDRQRDLTGIPASEAEPLKILAARAPHDSGPVVTISQHWPVWSRPEESDLSLAFVPWEESLLPPPMVDQLNNDFDGVLVPSRFAAKALLDSGVMRPVAVVGNGPEIDDLLLMGARRRAGPNRAAPTAERPFTFLHLSSCFPRKGVDVLLKAYAEAFRRSDPVRLVIKGFPNPHNDVDFQIAALRSADPELPAIEFVNEDISREEIAELLNTADAVVLPARGEGFNLPALEALAAGVPVIATGFGGHMDFLDQSVARLIDYRFSPSASHVAAPGSTWVEPDADDLAAAMREAFGSSRLRATMARTKRGWDRAKAFGSARDWAQRSQEASLDLLRAPASVAPKVAWISTWKVRCGIAEYSSMLLEHYPGAPINLTVLCDERTRQEDLDQGGGPPARVAWSVWQPQSVERLALEIDALRADAVVIQHQPGLIRWSDLARLLQHPSLVSRQVIIALHTVNELPPPDSFEESDLIGALRGASRLLVHTVRDLNMMKRYGLVENVTLFPHGVVRAGGKPPDARDLQRSAPVLVGSYGFFLPPKGLDQLIRAFAILSRSWPNARLRLVNAEFPGSTSTNEIAYCRALAQQLGVEGAIEWRTEFMTNDESKRLLRDCDLVVLCYQNTLESASGAVRVALASGAPVAVTPIPIFDDTLSATSPLPGVDAESIAEGIEALLMDRNGRARLQTQAAAWTADYAWPKLAARLAGMIRGLVATSLFPGGPNRFATFDAAEAGESKDRAAKSSHGSATAPRGPASDAGETRPQSRRNVGADVADAT